MGSRNIFLSWSSSVGPVPEFFGFDVMVLARKSDEKYSFASKANKIFSICRRISAENCYFWWSWMNMGKGLPLKSPLWTRCVPDNLYNIIDRAQGGRKKSGWCREQVYLSISRCEMRVLVTSVQSSVHWLELWSHWPNHRTMTMKLQLVATSFF